MLGKKGFFSPGRLRDSVLWDTDVWFTWVEQGTWEGTDNEKADLWQKVLMLSQRS